jgi:chitinase
MDGDGDGEALCDSGAYELEGAVVSLPEVNISPAVTVTEGHTGTITVTVAVMLSVTSTEPVTVTYVTVTNTATPEEDYQHITGTIVFDPGQTMHYITLTIYGDETTEVDELFIVRLDAVWNAVLGDTEAVITIENDDDPPAVFHTIYLPLILR